MLVMLMKMLLVVVLVAAKDLCTKKPCSENETCLSGRDATYECVCSRGFDRNASGHCDGQSLLLPYSSNLYPTQVKPTQL